MANCIYGSNKCPLNPEPTDLQRAIWRRHHKAGTSPGNPKWYRTAALPAPRQFKPGQPPKYPALESGAEYMIKHGDQIRPKSKDPFTVARGKETTAEYVAAYDKAAGLRPV